MTTKNTPMWLASSFLLFTYLHINVGFVRSHMNGKVFASFRKPFILFPLIVFALCLYKPWILMMITLAIYWDEYHSVMQTFGFGRMYDVKEGNNPHLGRRLDLFLCFLFEYMPHVLIVTYMVGDQMLKYLGEDGGIKIPAHWQQSLFSNAIYLRWALFGLAGLYCVVYVFRYVQLSRQGYSVSFNKVLLFLNTAMVTCLAVWFYTPFEATIMGNLYHAVQYIALIGVKETPRMDLRSFGNWGRFLKTPLVLSLSLVFVMFAFWRSYTASSYPLVALWVSSSLTHYFCDGFIWSMRRKDLGAEVAQTPLTQALQASST